MLPLRKDIEATATNQFHEMERKFMKSTTVPYRFIAEVGFFASRIEQFIRKTPVELLVIGNSMVDNFNEYKDQSFEQFLSTSKVPIVIAPKGIDDFITIESNWNKS